MMKKWLQTAKSDDRGESLRALQEVSKERITSVKTFVEKYDTSDDVGLEKIKRRGSST